jgi:hypothetical protein
VIGGTAIDSTETQQVHLGLWQMEVARRGTSRPRNCRSSRNTWKLPPFWVRNRTIPGRFPFHAHADPVQPHGSGRQLLRAAFCPWRAFKRGRAAWPKGPRTPSPGSSPKARDTARGQSYARHHRCTGGQLRHREPGIAPTNEILLQHDLHELVMDWARNPRARSPVQVVRGRVPRGRDPQGPQLGFHAIHVIGTGALVSRMRLRRQKGIRVRQAKLATLANSPDAVRSYAIAD